LSLNTLYRDRQVKRRLVFSGSQKAIAQNWLIRYIRYQIRC